MNNYNPQKHDYLNWKDDLRKIPEWDDGTHNKSLDNGNTKIWTNRDLKDGIAYALHREGDKPAYISHASISWHINGDQYRENDKPTEFNFNNDYMIWTDKHGRFHREENRPAIIHFNGYKEWWIDNQQYFPINSIRRSILFDPKPELFSKYIELGGIVIQQLLSPKFQKQLAETNPNLISLIPKELLIPEYEGLRILGDIGL